MTEADLAYYVANYRRTGFRGMLNYYRAMVVKPPDFSKGEPPKTSLSPEDASKIPNIPIQVPTLVVCGIADPLLIPRA